MCPIQKKRKPYRRYHNWSQSVKKTRFFTSSENRLSHSKFIKIAMAKQTVEKKNRWYESSKGKYLVFGKTEETNLIPYPNDWLRIAFEKIDANPLIKSWKFYNVHIPYVTKDHHSHFTIDIEAQTDSETKLITISPRGWRLRTARLILMKQIDAYCLEHKCTWEIWTKEVLDSPSVVKAPNFIEHSWEL